MELQEFKLPEWAWLDSHTHLGNILERREVLLHTHTLTIIEFICLDEIDFMPNENVRYVKFKHSEENYLAVVYKSLAEDVTDIINESIEFFKNEIVWMNKQIASDN